MRRLYCFFGCILLLLASGLPALAQEGTRITGRILDNSNVPLDNVSVTFEGSDEAPFITDSTGFFELFVPSSDVWINIAPVGSYKSKKVYLNRRSDLKVYLQREGQASEYDEIVYPGSAIQKRELVPDISSMSGEYLHEKVWESVDQDMQGRISGLYQAGMSGMPGSGTYMLVRGLNSVNSSNQPLIMVDGIPLETPGVMGSIADGYANNPLSSIDPMDISNITLIKDGSPLTQYGMKGSNGILLIETLKPVVTKTSIDFVLKTGLTSMSRRIPQLGTRNYKTLATEILTTSPLAQEQYEDLYPGLYIHPNDEGYYRYDHDTKWQDEIFRNAWMQDAYISVKGGDAIARYGLSVGFLNQAGIVDNTSFQRFNTRFVGTFNIFNWLRMYVSANLVSTNADYKESALVEETSPIMSALRKSPQLNPYAYDEQGRELEKIDDIEELGISNPLAVVNSFRASNANYRFLTSFKMEGDISPYLRMNVMLGLNINNLNESMFMPNLGMEYYFDNEAYNVSQSLNDNLFTIYNDNYLSFRKRLNNVHFINLIGGVRWQTNEYQEDWGISMNSNENDQYTNIGSGDNILDGVSGDNARWNWLSNYYSASYSYRDRYIADASISADFSSRIGKEATDMIVIGDVPFGLFYNIGVAWRVSNEFFLSGISAIDELKLRVNYGTSGNDDIGNFNALKYYRLKLFRETSGMVPGGYANEYLKHETVSQLSAGLDFGLMENRLWFTADYYNSTTENMLIYEQLSSYMGYNIFPSNGASLEKTGYDININSGILRLNDFNLDLGFNLGHYESTIAEIEGNEIITRLPGGAEIINRTGEPANSFYGYSYLGVFSTTSNAMDPDNPSQPLLVNERGVPFRAGDAIFEDIDGWDPVLQERTGEPDGVINEFDKVLLGSATPDFYGGLSIGMNYRQFSLGIFWQFVLGNENYNYVRYMNERMSDLSNQSVAVKDRWIYEGQETMVPRAQWDDPAGNSAFSSRWIEDASYARLKEITLAYRLPEGIGFFSNFSVFVTGVNLLTISDFISYDPEYSYSFHPKYQGIDYGLMPHGRRYMVGVRFGL